MQRKHFIIAVITAFPLLTVAASLAHVPYLEPQVVRRCGALAEGEDFSFEHPFIITSGTIVQSKAIFAYLSYGDVDVYQYTLEEGDTIPWMIAAALPPACRMYRNTYPATAVLGPGLPEPDPGEKLPFEIPEGYGVIVSRPEKVPFGEDRPVLSLSANVPVNISWFFPANPQTDFVFIDNLDVPGIYYVVIWNPEKWPCDYTANIGITEEFSEEDKMHEQIILPLYSDHKLLHFPCVEMEGPSPFE